MKHGFRLALADHEPLDRAEEYLLGFNIPVRRFVFQRAAGAHRAMRAVGNQTCSGVDRVRCLIGWPKSPSATWAAGFLAGIFDAEGSASPREVVRICNCDAEIVDWTERAFARLSFETTLERTVGRNGLVYVRLLGGLAEKLRFFVMTDPAIDRKRRIAAAALRARQDQRVVSIDHLVDPLPLIRLSTSSGDVVAAGVVCDAS